MSRVHGEQQGDRVGGAEPARRMRRDEVKEGAKKQDQEGMLL